MMHKVLYMETELNKGLLALPLNTVNLNVQVSAFSQDIQIIINKYIHHLLNVLNGEKSNKLMCFDTGTLRGLIDLTIHSNQAKLIIWVSCE